MATSVLQLQPEEQTLRKLTIAEYHKLVEAGVLHPKERVELLDGLLVQMAPIGPRHQAIVDQLTEEFSAQNKGRYKVSPWKANSDSRFQRAAARHGALQERRAR